MMRLFGGRRCDVLWMNTPSISADVVKIAMWFSVGPDIGHPMCAICPIANLKTPIFLAASEAQPTATFAIRDPFLVKARPEARSLRRNWAEHKRGE